MYLFIYYYLCHTSLALKKFSVFNTPIVAYLIFMSYFNLMRCLLRNVTLNVLKY